MMSDRRERVKALLDQVLDLEPERRDAFLARECGSDPDLLTEVRSLMTALDGADDPLERPALAGSGTPFGREGSVIGAYRLLRRIGEGGMGVVYEAERADQQFDRRVAIKLIHAGVDYQIREVLESAFLFGAETLRELGVPEEEIEEIIEDVRLRDAERLELQTAGGIHAGTNLLKRNTPVPTPLAQPRRAGKALNDETADVISGKPIASATSE